MNKYQRQTILPQVGINGQQKLAEARVLIVGAGGLGCALLPYLAAAGIGNLGIIDGDQVEESNLHRQILYTPKNIGEYKAEAAKAFLKAQQPELHCTAYAEYLSGENVLGLFKNYDIIIDATDRIEVRYLINDAAIITNKPVVYGSIHRFEGQVSVFNYINGPTYRCLFPKAVEVASCEEAGVLGTSVGLIGMLQAAEVLKIILETGNVLSGELLVYNTLTATQDRFKFKKNENIQITQESFNAAHKNNDSPKVSFSIDLLVNGILVDVRTKEEQPKIANASVLEIPLQELNYKVQDFESSKDYYFFCQSGARALQAVQLLKKHKHINAKALTEGAAQLQKLIATASV